MSWFESLCSVDGSAVAKLELLVRAAVFNTANQFVGWLLQEAVEAAQAAYQPKPGQQAKGDERLLVQGIFGHFELKRLYYYEPGKKEGHYPADAALGLEVGYTPALARLMCLEGADESTYLKAERHLEQTGGIRISARQIQRVVQRVGQAAQQWQERQAQPSECQRRPVPVMYISADGTGIPMVPEELARRKGKQADGTAKTRQVQAMVNAPCMLDSQRSGHVPHDTPSFSPSFRHFRVFEIVFRRNSTVTRLSHSGGGCSCGLRRGLQGRLAISIGTCAFDRSEMTGAGLLPSRGIGWLECLDSRSISCLSFHKLE